MGKDGTGQQKASKGATEGNLVRFRGITVTEKKLGRERASGIAVCGDMSIKVDPRQPPKEYMDTVIHELLHVMPRSREWSEKEVCHAAGILTHFLWKLGYRRIQQ